MCFKLPRVCQIKVKGGSGGTLETETVHVMFLYVFLGVGVALSQELSMFPPYFLTEILVSIETCTC